MFLKCISAPFCPLVSPTHTPPTLPLPVKALTHTQKATTPHKKDGNNEGGQLG